MSQTGILQKSSVDRCLGVELEISTTLIALQSIAVQKPEKSSSLTSFTTFSHVVPMKEPRSTC